MPVTFEAPRVLNPQSHCLWTPGHSGVNQRTCAAPTVALLPVDSFSRPCSAPRLLVPEVCTGTGACSLCSSLPALWPFLTLRPLIGLTQCPQIHLLWVWCFGYRLLILFGKFVHLRKKILHTILLITEKKSCFKLFILPAEQSGYLPVYSLTNKSIPSFL